MIACSLVPVGTSVTVLAAGPAVTLRLSIGPPTTVTTVTGSGFGANETVDLFFDTTSEALASTSATGSFTQRLTVPASASPGRHSITADGRASHLSAQRPFLVQTNWSSFRSTAQHTGVNPYENVLSPTNVPGMNQMWAVGTGNRVRIVARGRRRQCLHREL